MNGNESKLRAGAWRGAVDTRELPEVAKSSHGTAPCYFKQVGLLAVAGLLMLGGAQAAARAARPAAATKLVNVVKMLGAHVAQVKRRDGGVAVLLPNTVTLQGARYAAGTASSGRYQLELDYAEPCGGANACMAIEFLGRAGSAKPYGKAAVKLVDGISGAYSGIQCAASCSPAAIQWREHGVLYTITGTLAIELATKANPAAVRAAFAAAADQAISAGAR